MIYSLSIFLRAIQNNNNNNNNCFNREKHGGLCVYKTIIMYNDELFIGGLLYSRLGYAITTPKHFFNIIVIIIFSLFWITLKYIYFMRAHTQGVVFSNIIYTSLNWKYNKNYENSYTCAF